MSSATLDAYVFETEPVNASHTVPIQVIIPTRNGTHNISLGQSFTYEYHSEQPTVRDLHPKALIAEGGTKVTVVGTNFAPERNPRMNLTQNTITANTSGVQVTFGEVNYPIMPCTVRNESEMSCITPRLQLPSVDEFGSFKVGYRFGFIFDGLEYDQGSSKENDVTRVTTSTTIEISIVELPWIKDHNWSPYDETKKESLELVMMWGQFQHEAVVRVGGIASEITKRYDNKVLFFPPDEVWLDGKFECQTSSVSYSVEVQAGNINQVVGCLKYTSTSGASLTMILSIAVCVIIVVTVVSIISCYVIRKRTNKNRE
ncbi:hypothetical protein CAPTEDRAFT_201627 [Capitella teleta]|uniref:IPT/TIG domain-containing protein n=1 Tax=Capitella teleta TaxID=283909 RepID=R7V214_CAPTE|nr:hypothetical protein CAPTEDRAFT_201627 [Capitella teleta]|eukprot:ELU12579.1 hypothetical protein CAPTEDRAFT_201627 [Capitella teleta]